VVARFRRFDRNTEIAAIAENCWPARTLHRRPDGHSADFFDGGVAFQDFGDTVVPQQPHAAREGHVANLRGVRSVLDLAADGTVDREELEDADAATVAGLAAVGAAAAVGELLSVAISLREMNFLTRSVRATFEKF
jgi:hypothetical protein